ncbi:MAG: hypothetical protein HFH30_08770 [Eubacterium sp.]|nr:hypothetical protein [Eubacterium sp.]
MTFLLELKEKLRSFYGKYEVYLLPVIKFLLAAGVFWMIRQKIGYMERLNSVSLLLILSLACAILPIAIMLLAAGVLITLHCYALSMQAGVIMFVLFAIMYLLYFRYASRYAYNALLAPIACSVGIPYVMPVANGLLQPPVSVIPTICGMITYYFLNGIMANETSLSTVEEDEELIRKFQEIIKQFAGNREMYLSVALLAATAIIVYVIRRLSVDYSWTIAIVLGMLMQFLGYFIGYMEIGMSSRTSALVIGCLISTVILFLIQFLFFSLDYMRTERVQFEDDEYYYYVKAVPKSYVATREKKVKKISSRNKRERDDDVSREELMSDMDIYMDDEED